MEAIRKHQGAYLIEGILFLIIGTLAIVLPLLNSSMTVVIVGFLLAAGGVYRFIRNLVGIHDIGYEPLPMITSIVAALVGGYFLFNPAVSLITISLPLFILFILEGFNSIFQSRAMRPTAKYWNIVLFSGAISLIVAALSGLPLVALWTLGLLVGISMLIHGFSLALTTAEKAQSA
ncbi:MAG: DUF308 domain-containing protein [bacterium]